MNNAYWYLNNRKISFTTHATERVVERFKALSIVFPCDEDYIELAISGIEQVLNNPFMSRYLNNLISCSKHDNEDILVYDEVNKVVYAFVVKPRQNGRIVVKTMGTKRDMEEWIYSIYSHKKQKICWIYDGVFKFSTSNGNVTWY